MVDIAARAACTRVVVVRLINDIKRALERGGTLEEGIRCGAVGLGGEIVALERVCAQLFGRFDEALAHTVPAVRKRELARVRKARRALDHDIRDLDKLAARVGKLSSDGWSEQYG